MQTVIVYVHVKVGCADTFIAATIANARASRLEPGIVQFDLFQQDDDPNRFVLIEGYRTAEAPAQHKATLHYARWREAVAPMMYEARTSTKYSPIPVSPVA
jgi:quinol monooxygenase YgiN